jgi:hypothetical protein
MHRPAILLSTMLLLATRQQQTIDTLLARVEHLERAGASLPEGANR